MRLINMPKNNHRRPSVVFALLVCLSFFSACGGSGGGGGDDDGTVVPRPVVWEQTALYQLEVGGLTTPWVDASVDSSGQVHLAFFEETATPGRTNGISYLVYDPSAPPAPATAMTEQVVEVDNSSGLSLSLAAGDQPLVSYQGGQLRECGDEKQSDAMFSLRAGLDWEEYTAAIGDNPRNPVFQDGLAGSQVAAAVDSQGRLHLLYQFYYEGCDAMNFAYPDLRYVLIDPENPSAAVIEETVEGNDYLVSNEQNNVGEHAAIAFDSEDNPVVFYYAELADGSQGLRVARKTGQLWSHDWVEKNCEIGHISAARLDVSGAVAVAYHIKRYTDGRDDIDCLRFAREESSSWTVQMVDDSRRVGAYCSLTFDPAGLPLIAYREMTSHSGFSLENLKLARLTGSTWEREVIAEDGDIGYFNNIWVDDLGRTFIVSYSNTTKMLYQFRK